MGLRLARSAFLRHLRTQFLTGLLVLGPLAVTGYVVWRFFEFVDHLLGTELRGGYLRPGGIPGIGFLTVLVILYISGLLANNFLIRQLGGLIESGLTRIPYMKGIYTTVKEVEKVLLGEKRAAFQRVVLVEFPVPGRYALGFVTASPAGAVPQPGGRPLLAVFVPHVPNPATGMLLFYPEESVIPTSIKVDQAIKMVISAGVIMRGEKA
jgi:uncharacterized membrane protein